MAAAILVGEMYVSDDRSERVPDGARALDRAVIAGRLGSAKTVVERPVAGGADKRVWQSASACREGPRLRLTSVGLLEPSAIAESGGRL